jgi:hypothetical protein
MGLQAKVMRPSNNTIAVNIDRKKEKPGRRKNILKVLPLQQTG